MKLTIGKVDMRKLLHSQSGFTLLELFVVMVCIVILVLLVGMMFG